MSRKTGSRGGRELTEQQKVYERRIRSGYGRYIIPGALGTIVVLLIPFVANLLISCTNWRGGRSKMKWIGFDNYIRLFQDEKFWTSFGNSLYMIVAMVIIPLLIGLLLAAVLFDYIGREFGGKTASFLRACYYLPQILPVGVAGILWNWILNSQTGAINRILAGMFGLSETPDWLGDPNLAIYAVMLMLIWSQIGYPVVIFMSALGRVDPELYEAAALDGASRWQRIKSITIPLLMPSIIIMMLLSIGNMLRGDFANIYAIIEDNGMLFKYTDVIDTYVFRAVKQAADFGTTTAIGLYQSVVGFVLVVFSNWLAKKYDKDTALF